jgi:integral membrane protein
LPLGSTDGRSTMGVVPTWHRGERPCQGASMATNARTPSVSPAVRRFRVVALVEAVSYLVLLVAVVAKYGFDAPLGVRIMGPVHGIIFLVYAGLAFRVREELRWSAQHTFAVLAAAVIPLGGYLVERSLSPARAATPTTPAR